jgi:hypothetical protein
MSEAADDADYKATTHVLCRKALPYPITRRAADTLEMRIVLYDALETAAIAFPQGGRMKDARGRAKREAEYYAGNPLRTCPICGRYYTSAKSEVCSVACFEKSKKSTNDEKLKT